MDGCISDLNINNVLYPANCLNYTGGSFKMEVNKVFKYINGLGVVKNPYHLCDREEDR